VWGSTRGVFFMFLGLGSASLSPPFLHERFKIKPVIPSTFTPFLNISLGMTGQKNPLSNILENNEARTFTDIALISCKSSMNLIIERNTEPSLPQFRHEFLTIELCVIHGHEDELEPITTIRSHFLYKIETEKLILGIQNSSFGKNLELEFSVTDYRKVVIHEFDEDSCLVMHMGREEEANKLSFAQDLLCVYCRLTLPVQ